MKISVLGCGRWGSFIAWYLSGRGFPVALYGRENSPRFALLKSAGKNEYVTLGENVALTSSLEEAAAADVLVVSVKSAGLRELLSSLRPFGLAEKTLVLCMKGVEENTGKRLSEIAVEEGADRNKVAVWVGPGHIQAFAAGLPNCMLIDAYDHALTKKLADAWRSDLIRFYYGDDIVGSEIGAAAKNVFGIAAGMLDGMGLSSLKGALMSRGTREVSRLIAAMGGNGFSAYGLCHLGDYEATVFSPFSHNRMFGELFVKGEKYDKLAEGYYTVKAIMHLKEQYNVDLPVCEAVYSVLYSGVSAEDAISKIFKRTLKAEF